MPTLTLPPRPDREWLRGFTVAAALGTGLLMAALARWTDARHPIRLGVAVAILVGTPGLIRPLLMYRLYRSWNRLARGYARFSRRLLMRVCYYTVIAVVARAGSGLKRARPGRGGSLWTPRGMLSPAAYTSQDDAPGAAKDGLTGVLLWSIRSGQLWVAFLVPFLALIRAFEVEAKGAPPADIYTLY